MLEVSRASEQDLGLDQFAPTKLVYQLSYFVDLGFPEIAKVFTTVHQEFCLFPPWLV